MTRGREVRGSGVRTGMCRPSQPPQGTLTAMCQIILGKLRCCSRLLLRCCLTQWNEDRVAQAAREGTINSRSAERLVRPKAGAYGWQCWGVYIISINITRRSNIKSLIALCSDIFMVSVSLQPCVGLCAPRQFDGCMVSARLIHNPILYIGLCYYCTLVGVHISNQYFPIAQVPQLLCPAHRGTAVVLYWGLGDDNTHNSKTNYIPSFGICLLRLDAYASLYVQGLPVRDYINHHDSDWPFVYGLTQDNNARDDVRRIWKYQLDTYQIRSGVVGVSAGKTQTEVFHILSCYPTTAREGVEACR